MFVLPGCLQYFHGQKALAVMGEDVRSVGPALQERAEEKAEVVSMKQGATGEVLVSAW